MMESTEANILILHEGEQPTLMLVFQAFERLKRMVPGLLVQKQFSSRLSKRQMAAVDTVVCVRGESPLTYAWLRYAKAMGKFLVFFLDDDLKDLPRDYFRYPRRSKWLLKCISQCDVLMTPNQLIADEYSEFLESRRAVVSHTAVFEEEISRSEGNQDKVKVVYAASEGHIPNFNKFIKPILRPLFERYGAQLEMHLVGLHPEVDVGAFNTQVIYTPSMTMAEYNAYMKSNHFDIGVAPLVTTHFSERKYFNKYIEYSKVGICGVYSKVMPYQLVIEDGWNGYYAENTPEAWLEAIIRAIEYPEERERIVENAQQHLRTCHSEEKIFQSMLSMIPELTEHISEYSRSRKPDISIGLYKIRHFCFRVCETVYLTWYSATHFGFKTTWQKINRKLGVKE